MGNAHQVVCVTKHAIGRQVSQSAAQMQQIVARRGLGLALGRCVPACRRRPLLAAAQKGFGPAKKSQVRAAAPGRARRAALCRCFAAPAAAALRLAAAPAPLQPPWPPPLPPPIGCRQEEEGGGQSQARRAAAGGAAGRVGRAERAAAAARRRLCRGGEVRGTPWYCARRSVVGVCTAASTYRAAAAAG